MTANQIAAASVRVEERKADEQERHNASVEAETERANRVAEELNQRRLDLEEFRANAEKNWNDERNRIQEEYNRMYLAWQQAQGQEKLRLEGILANLEGDKHAADVRYKEAMQEVAIREARIKELAQLEEVTKNRNSEKIRDRELDIEEYGNWLKAKQIEYQNSYWTGSLLNQSLQIQNQASYWTLSNAIEQQKVSNQYDLGLLGLQSDLTKMQIDAYKTKKQLGIDYANAVFTGIRSLVAPLSGGRNLW